jgi:hypothetical protein
MRARIAASISMNSGGVWRMGRLQIEETEP